MTISAAPEETKPEETKPEEKKPEKKEEEDDGITAFVKRCYRAYLYREADPEGLAQWTALLDGGTGIEAVMKGFAGSGEFRTVLNGLK